VIAGNARRRPQRHGLTARELHELTAEELEWECHRATTAAEAATSDPERAEALNRAGDLVHELTRRRDGCPSTDAVR
jgi:hypothetical protein